MKFSIIVPVYNVQDYLEQCVSSVLAQSCTDYELILVDDGSSDRSPEICDRFAAQDQKIRVIHKANGGASEARNTGIKNASGEYVLFLDSDDFWHSEEMLDRIAESLSETGAVVMQFGFEEYLNNENRIVPGPVRTLSHNNGKSFEDSLAWLVVSGNLTIAAYSMVISRNFLLSNNLYFKKGLRTEDLEWAIRMFVCRPKLAFLDSYFYAYRVQHGGTVTSQIDYGHLCDYCWILEKSVKLVETCEERLKSILMSYLMYHALIAIALSFRKRVNLSREQKKEILSRLKAVTQNRITKYTLSKKVKLACLVYRIAGFEVMAAVLGFYLNNRGR